MKRLALMLIIGMATFGRAAPAEALDFPVCGPTGATITKSIKLGANVGELLTPCVEHGLIAAKDGITIDLNGYRIFGNGATSGGPLDAGVLVQAKNVTVKNGYIEKFEVGAGGDPVPGLRVSNLTLHKNDIGIFAVGARAVVSRNIIEQNVNQAIAVQGNKSSIIGNAIDLAPGITGIKFEESSRGVIRDNVVRGGANGIIVDEGPKRVVKGNTVIGSTSLGIRVDSADGTIAKNVVHVVGLNSSALRIDGERVKVLNNHVSARQGYGINVDGAPDALVKSNTAYASDRGISIGSSGVTVAKNFTGANVFAGISVLSSDVSVVGNRANGNGFDGIFVDTVSGPVIKKNQASGNGWNDADDDSGFGINAASAVDLVTLDNVADGNEGPLDCSDNVDCDPPLKPLPPLAPGLFCESELDHSARLSGPVSCPGGSGITITKSGVTLDLNGMRVTGPGGGSNIGVNVLGGVKNVTVKGGVIRSFGLGIQGDVNSSGIRVKNMTMLSDDTAVQFYGTKSSLTGSSFQVCGPCVVINGREHVVAKNVFDTVVGSIQIPAGRERIVSRNIIRNDFGTGIEVTEASARADRIIGNTLNGVAANGIVTHGSSTVVKGNTITDAGDDGILVDGPDAHVLDNNVTSAARGIRVESGGGALRPRVRGNAAHGNTESGIDVEGARAKISGNAAHLNAYSGVRVVSSNASIKSNRALGNGEDGFAIGSAHPVIKDNRANGNGYEDGNVGTEGYGIEDIGATAPVSSGNRADGNDVDEECSEVLDCFEGPP